VRIEFRKASHRRREKIFQNRAKTELANLINDVASVLEIPRDPKLVEDLKQVLLRDTFEVLNGPIRSASSVQGDYHSAVHRRAEEIIRTNNLKVRALDNEPEGRSGLPSRSYEFG
jgi:hypothetical protein